MWVDYYNGNVKTYQLSKVGKFGMYFKKEPVLHAIKCFKCNGTAQEKVMPQSVLPDLSNFQFKGEANIHGLKAEKWEYELNYDNIQIMYLYWRMEGSTKVIVPMRYEVIGLGHHYVDYDKFLAGSPSPDTFKVQNEMSCIHMDESEFVGVEQRVYSFNPIQEYIENVDSHMDMAWKNYKEQFNKKYTAVEDRERKNNFRQNMRFITSMNRRKQSFSMGVNKMTDYNPEEIKSLTSCVLENDYTVLMSHSQDQFEEFDNETESQNVLPESWDWRSLGAVTPVRDQFDCGSCWSFSAVGAIEGAYFVRTNILTTLSEQALLDCSWTFGNKGCGGGSVKAALTWVMSNKNIPLARNYGPYKAMPDFCHVKGFNGINIKNYMKVKKGCPACIKRKLKKYGPISVTMNVNSAFMFYKSGVFNETCPVKPQSHAVLIVGYGTLQGQDYWLIKNSWGNTWGIEGYALVAIKNNVCGLMENPIVIQ